MLNETFLWFSNTVVHFWSWLRSTYCWCCCRHNKEFCNHQIKGVPDVGKFVYRHVHSLHHKSYNPTAFSGTSMHPVEATLYYTAACMPALLGFHPVLALGCIADCAFGAWLGHDGFQVNRVILKLHFSIRWRWYRKLSLKLSINSVEFRFPQISWKIWFPSSPQ